MTDFNRVLVVEDSLPLATIYQSYMNGSEYIASTVPTLEKALQEIQINQPDIILLDVELPDGSGIDFLQKIMDVDPHIQVIVMTAHGSSNMAMEAIQTGAVDFLTKPFDAGRLLVTLNNAREYLKLNRKVATLSQLDRDRYLGLIGKSLAMQGVYRVLDSVSPSNATAFIMGESGTGKELTAEAIHKRSARADKPFFAINCGAIPHELMESEIFGHVKGAFTGATNTREGAATIANGGTLFLDELCEMDLDLQKKLLRFIQTGEFHKVGSNQLEKVDVRFVCATNKDPLQEVKAGRFREDLYYRLHVVPINLPPLRERDDDVMLIANHLLRELSRTEQKSFRGFSAEVKEVFGQYPWPGNVRELQNVVQQAVVLNQGDAIEMEMLPKNLLETVVIQPTMAPEDTNVVGLHAQKEASVESLPDARHDVRPLWIVEKEAIEKAIHACGGNINRASGLLEVAPSTIYRKVQSWSKDKEA